MNSTPRGILGALLTVAALLSLPIIASTRVPEPKQPGQPKQMNGVLDGEWYLGDGDRVLFYGDSITEQRLYTTYVETYYRSRFPRRNITFVHSGWGGDRVTGGGGGPIDQRLRRDVLAYKPTVITICLGMNDGGYRAFDPALYAEYVQGYRHILDTLKRELPRARITLLTAPAFDDVTRAAAFPGGYNTTLIAYGEAVKQLGREYNLRVADTNAPMISMLARARVSNAELAAKIIPDRVHPGPGGHVIMAAAVLTAWNAPMTVADIEIDADRNKILRQTNSLVSKISLDNGVFTFTHADSALPWPLDRDAAHNQDMVLSLAVSDIEQAFNRYRLKINNMSAAKYALKVDGQDMGTVASEDLARGVDLAALPALPPNLQAQQVLALTRKHNDLHFQRWRDVQVPHTKDGEPIPADIQKRMDALDAQEVEVLKELHKLAQPVPHTVQLTPLP